jgi:hypothetical protein
VDISFLGLGIAEKKEGKLIWGHIGFNEPFTTTKDCKARIVKL